MTLQGRAIRRASIDFGDGKTLPFCPCKRGYMPTKINTNTKTNVKMVACSFHEQARRKRLARERGKLRGGEADPNELFWSKEEAENDNTVYVQRRRRRRRRAEKEQQKALRSTKSKR
eukprot:CAMPEP_0168170584 /NCGR_PEP_ID=MMETSP0139_2-20121125/4259_1 /TAXON_ID=44445 /ORGANISM="Pseudo-nitzschia australis, Strain 10249 10 AB" /LENGTH=116 /DNA_ID=CAMNT_0008088099 /DNA_START=302 /DNA_END=652 /DNA_ORIENTATION=-